MSYFKAFVGNNIDSDLEAIHNATREADKKIQDSKNAKGNDKTVLIR